MATKGRLKLVEHDNVEIYVNRETGMFTASVDGRDLTAHTLAGIYSELEIYRAVGAVWHEILCVSFSIYNHRNLSEHDWTMGRNLHVSRFRHASTGERLYRSAWHYDPPRARQRDDVPRDVLTKLMANELPVVHSVSRYRQSDLKATVYLAYDEALWQELERMGARFGNLGIFALALPTQILRSLSDAGWSFAGEEQVGGQT